MLAPGERRVQLVGGRRAHAHSPRNDGIAAFRRGAHALGEVGRVAQPGLLRVLVLHGQPGLLHQAAAQRGPDGADGQRPRRGQLVRVGDGLRQQVVLVGQAVTQAERQRLLAADAPPGEQQVRRRLAADDGRQRHRQREAVVEAQAGEVGAEAALRRGHPEVGRQREPAAAADGGALHGGHHGQRGGEQAQRGPVQRGDVLAGVAGEVQPGAEVPALRRQHDRPAPARAVQLLVGRRPRRRSARCRSSCWAAGAGRRSPTCAPCCSTVTSVAHGVHASPSRCPPGCASRSRRPRRRRRRESAPPRRSRAGGTWRGRGWTRRRG